MIKSANNPYTYGPNNVIKLLLITCLSVNFEVQVLSIISYLKDLSYIVHGSANPEKSLGKVTP